MPVLIPPAGQCAVCHAPLAAAVGYLEVALARVEAQVTSQPRRTELGVIRACNDEHMGIALERLGRMAQQNVTAPPAGSPDWARQHGVLVAPPVARDD